MLKILFFILLILNNNFIYGQIENYSQHRIPCEPTQYLINYFYILKFKYPKPEKQNDLNVLTTFTNEINSLFAPTCIQFKVCKIDTIHDYNYYALKDDPKTNEVSDIVNQYYNPHAINIYWVADHQDQSFKGICWNLKSKPAIFIAYPNDLPESVQYFKVQMLKYFGLKSTASTTVSSELVNGSNGKIAADSLWDSPADPMGLPLSSSDLVIIPPYPFDFFYTNMKDANGDFYNPMIYNLMSVPQSLSKCYELTREQYQLLIKNERQCRLKRWGI